MQPIIIWDDWNLGKIEAHNVSPEEVEEVLDDPGSILEFSRSSGLPLVKGYTNPGRYLVVVCREEDEFPLRIYPITAFAPGE